MKKLTDFINESVSFFIMLEYLFNRSKHNIPKFYLLALFPFAPNFLHLNNFVSVVILNSKHFFILNPSHIYNNYFSLSLRYIAVYFYDFSLYTRFLLPPSATMISASTISARISFALVDFKPRSSAISMLFAETFSVR